MRYARANDNVPADEMRLAAQVARQGALQQRSNARFAGLTAAGKRVQIARDVLVWLNLGKLKPEYGTYLRTVASTKIGDAECIACALGAMFACQVERQSGLKLTSINKDGGMHEALRDFFSENQLSLIETAFEGEEFGYWYEDTDEMHRALTFNARRTRPESRMRAIMENIIANGGEFVP